MPWVSDAQRRWGNSPSGHAALGDKGVNEWNQASKGKSLPEKVSHPVDHIRKRRVMAGHAMSHGVAGR